uniref:Serine:threonine protein kinase SMG1 n=1 Tax=Echinococcus granulosus TaxID=6210 RepID=A0A068WHD0_ECHGR|nr:serine:threonine protein kinase SMG1 [Echinococcus granulosus]
MPHCPFPIFWSSPLPMVAVPKSDETPDPVKLPRGISDVDLGWRPIHFAATRGHVTTVDMLVASGADVDVYTKKNETPLLLAQSAHMWDTVRKLVQLGASFDDRTEAILIQSAQKSCPPNDINSKRKKFSENSSSKFDHKNFNEATIGAQMAQMSISSSSGLVDLHTSSLIKLLQFQGCGYDFDLSRQKWELTSQMQSLPPPFPSRHYNRFNQLVKRIISANLSQRFRISSAKQLIELLDSLELSSSKSTRINKRGAPANGFRSVETHLRVLEITVCEKHCPVRLISLIGDICIHLVVFYGLYKLEDVKLESDTELSCSQAESSHLSGSSNELKVAYVARMLRSLSCNTSSQYRSGILSFISRILSSCSSSTGCHQNTVCDVRVCQITANLISDLVSLTDSLDQAGNVSRLARFISLVGAYNQLEFSKRFSDLADILIGWCVDASSGYRGVAVGTLLSELSCNLRRWWFDLSSPDTGHLLTESTCDMLGHLLEDADVSLQKAVSEYRQISSSFVPRRNAQAPFVSTEISQKLIATNLYFAVLAGICLGVKKCLSESHQSSCVKFVSLDFSGWNKRLLNILHGLELMSPAVALRSKPSSASRTYVPPTYCLPLLTYGDIVQHVHAILLFTESTMPVEGDQFGQKVRSYLSQPPNESILQLSPCHIKILCELAYCLLKRTPKNSPSLVISTFKVLFGNDTLLHRLKTSSSGSLAVFNLLCDLSKRHLSSCDMLVMIVEMCIADFQLACTKLASGKCSIDVENDLLILFSASLFATIWKSVSNEPERVALANAANGRLILILADLHRQFAIFSRISQRIRLAFWTILISTLNYGIDRTAECGGDLLLVIQQLLLTASNNLQELILSKHLLQTISDSLAIQLSHSFCTYLLRLLQNPYSPVRANDGSYFCEAVRLLIRVWKGKTASSEVLELAYLCVSHPLPRIQSSGADLLLLFGPSLAKFESTRAANFMLHWYLSTSLELSTSLITCSLVNPVSFGAAKESGSLLRAQGAFPSLPAAAGVLGILTRGAPYLSEERTSRLELLTSSSDWLRRLACLISPLPSDSSTNWYASDTSPLSLVFLFTTWSMVDYKLKVAPWANPVKTFLSIEAIIHALLSSLTKRMGTHSLVPELQSFLGVSSTVVIRQSLAWQINQSALVINFMRLLEKATTNAVDGFAVVIPPVHPTAHAFFKANSMTCHQWFNRVRMPLATLAVWLAPLSLEGSEAAATVIWNVYSLFHQVLTSDPPELLNTISVFGNPEKIILCVIQALHHLGAADELALVYACLERIAVNSTKSGVHLYSWVHGLVCILGGGLDAGLSCFSAFFESYPLPLSSDSFGALSYEFARRLFTALLVRVGYSGEATLRLCCKKDLPDRPVACNNQGDNPMAKRKNLANNGKKKAMDELPLRYSAIANQRLQTLQKLSTWDNAISALSPSSNSVASILTEQEDKLLSLGSDSVSEVINVVRQTANAVVSLADFGNYQDCRDIPRLEPEPSLPALALEADLLFNRPTALSAVGDICIGTWSMLTRKNGNLSVFLDACEPLLIPHSDDYLPVDSSRGVALNLLRQQLTALDIQEEITNYIKLVDIVNSRADFSSLDRMRLIRYIANLLWTSDGGNNDRIAAMTCLSQGLLRNVLGTNTSDRIEHAKQCLLNVSVALQLFKFLTYASSSTQAGEIRTMCQEVFFTCASEAGVCEVENVTPQGDAQRLVQHLLQFGRLASSPWVDGVPLVSPSDETEATVASSPSELQMRLLMFATHLSPTNASALAWLQMAHWCYERGQHDVKQTKTEAMRVLACPQSDSITTTLFDALTPDECESLSQLLPSNIIEKNKSVEARILAKLYTFLSDDADDFRSHHHCIDDLSDADIPFDDPLRCRFVDHLSNGTNLTGETLALDGPLLSGCASLASLLTTRLYTLQSFAAQAYVTFLSVAGQHINDNVNALDVSKPCERIQPIQSTLATLRLLHLLDEPCRFLRITVKNLVVHGSSTDSVLLSPPSPLTTIHSGPLVWTGCLPQILDRLGHPDPTVRRCLLDLLSRLIRMTNRDSPSTDRILANRLVFPTIVGSKGVDCAQLDIRTRSHGKLVSTLCDAGYGIMVEQVASFIVEMRRIAVLWEELWSGVLIQHVDDLNRKVNALEQVKTATTTDAPMSSAKVAESPIELGDDAVRLNNIHKLRYEALLAPTFSIFQQLRTLTLDTPAQTSHEAWFQSTFKQHIDETVVSLKKFCSPSIPNWKTSPVVPLQRLLSRFQTLNQKTKKGDDEKARHLTISSRFLSLFQISPNLFALNGSLEIPLPGRAHLHLARVGSKISVYPTKTRPKRVVFWTEEGQSFPYLLKCLEDLRLDARIMGLMRLTNTAFRSRSRARAIATARTYSVTPIGPKAGLIQMVQGAIPIFTLYKRWQQRKAIDAAPYGIVSESFKMALPKPSELFYNKLKEFLPPPLTSSSSRSSWPKDVLLKVFHTLESETPADLLTRELWAASPNMSAWWRASQTFASSLGITSAFGYLIGLGDRHLDNLLIDLTTGTLIHIDFNVCFDEGRSLRVPELVPFRFTRILRHPLGPLCDPSSISSGGGGTFGANFLETLSTCASIQELFLIQLQSFAIDPLTDWMRATAKGPAWSTFDLTYFAAYRGGCLSTSADTLSSSGREPITKRRRVFERLLVELQRSSGLLAARFAELVVPNRGLCEHLYSAMNVLESNLRVWETYREKQLKVEEFKQQLAILKGNSSKELAGFESRWRDIEQAKHQVLEAKKCLLDFADNMEYDIGSALHLLTKWLAKGSGVFSLPEDANKDLAKIINDYQDIAGAYIVPNDSSLHFTIENTLWFSTKRQLIHALRKALDNSIFKSDIKSSFAQFFHPPRSLLNRSGYTRLQGALTEAKTHLSALKSQHFIPSSSALNDFPSLLTQSEATLTTFISEQDAVMILPAFKWALIKNLAAMIHSTLTLEPLEHIDFLHQRVSAVACAFSVLDPSGNSSAIPFWAGHEADANCELQFFLTIYQLITKLVELRDNLCNLLLPKLEDAIQVASRAELELLDCLQQVMYDSGEAEEIQNEVNRLLTENNNGPLSEVFLAIHLAFLNATSEMEELCRRLIDYPITAVTWVHVDVISRAIANLQSRCAVEQGATSLWGWRHATEQGAVTTWLNEVYAAGMASSLKVAIEISQLWTDIRDGKVQHSIPSIPYVTILESQFFTHLADRLALVSESVLACSRLLLSLLEESGFTVRQAIFEIERMVPLSHLRGPPTVFVDRMIHSAELYFLSVQPPEVHALSATTGSVLASMFTTTSSHMYTAVAAKQIDAHEAHVKLIQRLKQVFDWLHDSKDESETSLRRFLNRLETSIAKVRTENEQLNDSTRELCELGDAICSAEYDRLRESSCMDELLPLFADYDSRCEAYTRFGDELTVLDSIMLNMKKEYGLTWPATEWTQVDVPGPSETNMRLVDAISTRLVKAQKALEESAERLHSLTLALTTTGAASTTSKSFATRKKKSNSTTSQNQNCQGEIAEVALIRQLFCDFEKNFLSEMRPYIKQLLRLSQLYNDAECERIWSRWLEDQDAWLATSGRLVQNFSDLLTDLVTDSNEREEAVFSSVRLILHDSLYLRNDLTPLLTKLIETGIWVTLKKSDSATIVATIRELGFGEKNRETDVESKLSDSALSEDRKIVASSSDTLTQEQISPEAIEALRRLCRRLQGVDDLLTKKDDAPVMSLTDQADLCIRTAMDPKHLSIMFEGWTPWCERSCSFLTRWHDCQIVGSTGQRNLHSAVYFHLSVMLRRLFGSRICEGSRSVSALSLIVSSRKMNYVCCVNSAHTLNVLCISSLSSMPALLSLVWLIHASRVFSFTN